MKSHPLFEKLRIFAPGPTPVPESVLAAMSLPPLHHRTKEFSDILDRTRKNLSWLFETTQRSYVLSSSGTGAMEATLVNLMATGDEVIVINGGKFGERWTKLAEKYGLKVHELKVEWGQAVDPAQVAGRLKQNPQIRAVLFQASETSTGVYHPVKEIAEAVRKNSDALVCVDAITALGVCPLPMDAWGLDAVVSGSQKAFMLPPGLAFLALSEKANQARKRANIPNFYFNLNEEDKVYDKAQTAWTPAVSLIVGLDMVLAKMREAGLEAVFQHHARLAEGTRQGVVAMGLSLLAKSSPSAAVTSVLLPSGMTNGDKIISLLRDRYGMTVADGQDHYKGKMFRLSHLGYYDELDMLTVLSAVELALDTLGIPVKLGAGVGAAARYFRESENRS
jgi:aspartate aminotransferase-like enzyme